MGTKSSDSTFAELLLASMMLYRIGSTLLAVLAVCGVANRQHYGAHALPGRGALIWEPPRPQLPGTLPRPTVPKEMVTALRVANLPIVLERTVLKDVQQRLGGTIGASGDRGDFVRWLCFHGRDGDRLWALWLESSEMGGGRVDGFTLQSLRRDAQLDQRCRALPQENSFELPLTLRLGLTESALWKILGSPTVRYRSTLIYDHEHELRIHNKPYTSWNTVALTQEGIVWAIRVWKITSSQWLPRRNCPHFSCPETALFSRNRIHPVGPPAATTHPALAGRLAGPRHSPTALTRNSKLTPPSALCGTALSFESHRCGCHLIGP
jgi:hypothetical protein